MQDSPELQRLVQCNLRLKISMQILLRYSGALCLLARQLFTSFLRLCVLLYLVTCAFLYHVHTQKMTLELLEDLCRASTCFVDVATAQNWVFTQ